MLREAVRTALESGCLAFMMNKRADIWYVSFRRPNEIADAYVRNSRSFRTEMEAKKFARERLNEGCDISAGTINPYRPKVTIGSLQVLSWLEGNEN
jgi:hypothetical protein